MCTLIHNVLNTDFVTLIKDDDSVKGLKIIHDGIDVLVQNGVDRNVAEAMKDLFGVSSICNIIGAIKMAKYLHLGPDDNIVTIATDGYDRYDSVIKTLEKRYLETADFVLQRWFVDVFRKNGTEDIVDYRPQSQKEKLFRQKESDWIKFGYSQAYLDSMQNMSFWDHEYEKVFTYDESIKKQRKE